MIILLRPQIYIVVVSIFSVERVSVYYSISSEPFAGLPVWLSFYQRNSSAPGILYGMPTFRDVGRLDVQAIAIDRNTFDDVMVTVSIDVVEYVASTGKFMINRFTPPCWQAVGQLN